MDLNKLRKVAQKHTNSIESKIIHFTDPVGSGPVIPDMNTSTTYQAENTDELNRRFNSLITANPSEKKDFPEGAATLYSRLGTKNEMMLARLLAMMEGGETSVIFSEGMSAIRSAVEFRAGRNTEVIAGVPIYGCTDNLFSSTIPSRGRPVKFLDFDDLDSLQQAITRATRVVYLETIANPSMKIADIPEIKKIILKENNKRQEMEKITLVVDNTFATPYCSNPLKIGPHLEDMIVLHSMSKALNGFASSMGGVCVIPWKYWKSLYLYRKNNGGILGGTDTHQFLTKTVKTLQIRMEKAIKSSKSVSTLLETHPVVKTILYPGSKKFKYHKNAKKVLKGWDGKFRPGNMMGFVLKGSSEEESEKACKTFIDYMAKKSLNYINAVSLGYLGTLIEDPNGGTHATISENERVLKGIPRGLIRLSVGIEDEQDLLVDMIRALDYVKYARQI